MGLKYSETDFKRLKDQLISTVTELTDNWNDFNESDIGMTLVDLMARLNDLSSYRRDRLAGENLLPTATERKSVKNILKLINYKMHHYIANQVTVSITPDSEITETTVIPAYTPFAVSTADYSDTPLFFTNITDITLYAGQTNVVFTLHQGEPFTLSFTKSDIGNNGVLYLGVPSVAEGTVRLETFLSSDEGSKSDVWTEVDDIDQALAAGTYFHFDVDKEGNEFLKLYGVYDSLLESTSPVSVQLVSTLGKLGVVGSAKNLKINLSGFTGYSVVTLSAAVGGSDPETIGDAKKYGPLSVKMMDTLVTLSDYGNKAEAHPSVYKCSALDWTIEGSGVYSPYLVHLYVVPETGYTVDDTFKGNLVSYLSTNKLSSLVIEVFEAEYVSVSFTAVFYVRNLSAVQDRVNSNINAALDAVFSAEKTTLGASLYFSDVMATLQEADSNIVSVTIDGLSSVGGGVKQCVTRGTISFSLVGVR